MRHRAQFWVSGPVLPGRAPGGVAGRFRARAHHPSCSFFLFLRRRSLQSWGGVQCPDPLLSPCLPPLSTVGGARASLCACVCACTRLGVWLLVQGNAFGCLCAPVQAAVCRISVRRCVLFGLLEKCRGCAHSSGGRL